jgi:hypothetical protein
MSYMGTRYDLSRVDEHLNEETWIEETKKLLGDLRSHLLYVGAHGSQDVRTENMKLIERIEELLANSKSEALRIVGIHYELHSERSV